MLKGLFLSSGLLGLMGSANRSSSSLSIALAVSPLATAFRETVPLGIPDMAEYDGTATSEDLGKMENPRLAGG